MNANRTVLRMKYGRIVAQFAAENHLDNAKALGMFYDSLTWELMSEGVSDFHCLSDNYIVDNLNREYHFGKYLQKK
ncbi:MAG: DUF3791 domain-containing protein [Bacteroidales bacterium]|jgi:hypothetical protein|nr:DUF3791 domain-containing protein [Bacteroidales bacterium]